MKTLNKLIWFIGGGLVLVLIAASSGPTWVGKFVGDGHGLTNLVAVATTTNTFGDFTGTFTGDASTLSMTNVSAVATSGKIMVWNTSTKVVGVATSLLLDPTSGLSTTVGFTGNGASLTNLNGTNVFGSVASAVAAVSATTATTATTASALSAGATIAAANGAALTNLNGTNVSGSVASAVAAVSATTATTANTANALAAGATIAAANGAALTNLNGTNVTGSVANAVAAVTAGTASAGWPTTWPESAVINLVADLGGKQGTNSTLDAWMGVATNNVPRLDATTNVFTGVLEATGFQGPAATVGNFSVGDGAGANTITGAGATGTLTASNVVAQIGFSGPGPLITGLNGTNVSGYVANAVAAVTAAGGWPAFVLKAGDTVAGPLLSTSSTTNAPSQTELATAGWVRGLFNGGMLDYSTTNIQTGTNTDTASQPLYQFEAAIPANPATRSYVNPGAGTYLGSVATTNTFTFLQGPVTVNAYIGMTAGGGDAAAIHPEIYYSYDKTNWYGDWVCQKQNITPGVTNLYQFVVSFPSYTATNQSGFYVERRYKLDTKGGSPTLYFLVGTNFVSGINDASHISFDGPSSAAGNAFLANNQTFTGTNTFTTGTRTFSHDGGHTVITNTATRVSTEFTSGQQIEWYNGTKTTISDKTNGTIMAVFGAWTNTWVPDGVLVCGSATNWTYSVGASTHGITAASIGTTFTQEPYAQLTILATGDIVFTNAATLHASDFLSSRTITNGNSCCIAVDMIPGVWTNMAIVQFK